MLQNFPYCIQNYAPFCPNFALKICILYALLKYLVCLWMPIKVLWDVVTVLLEYIDLQQHIFLSKLTKSVLLPELLSILLLLYSVQHWRSTATCAAALELPNLNYVHGTELALLANNNANYDDF